jgi:molybdopterin-guanine dinucleotide biosynthesis protein B
LVEGFKQSDLPKIEVWRPSTGQPVRYPTDDFVVAIATDSADQLPEPTLRPVLNLNDVDQVADWLLSQAARFEYQAPL